MSAEPLPEPGPELARRNRRILADRQSWPAGHLEECERLEEEHPGWSTSWLPANRIVGFERPARFVAYPVGAFASRRRAQYAATAAELAELIA